MTEAEWLTCDDPRLMLEFLQIGTGRAKLGKLLSKPEVERKLRLFLVGCCRRIWTLLTDARSRRAVEVAEQYADGVASKSNLETAQQEADAAYSVLRSKPDPKAFCAACPPAQAVRPLRQGFDVCVYGSEVAAMAPAARETTPEGVPLYDENIQRRERSLQADLFRDLFGNPFRPATADPAWLTPTVTSLAQAIYDERAFDRLPLLGDALEDAGCINEEILNHCRQPGEHARGCWPVDLLLGKP